MQEPWNPSGQNPQQPRRPARPQAAPAERTAALRKVPGRSRDPRVAPRQPVLLGEAEPFGPARSDAAVTHWEGILEALLLELRLEENRPLPPAQRGVIKQEFCRALQSVWEHGIATGRRMRRQEEVRRGRVVEVRRGPSPR